MTIEEELLYPTAKEVGETDDVDEGIVEHDAGKTLIAEIVQLSGTEELYKSKVHVLGEQTIHHIDEEDEELFEELQPWVTDFEGHPWDWAAHLAGERTPRKGEGSRWNAGKDLSFVPLRPERVVEVRYEHMEGERFRHTAQFNRWRPDRDPRSCTYEQLDQPVTFELNEIVPGLMRAT